MKQTKQPSYKLRPKSTPTAWKTRTPAKFEKLVAAETPQKNQPATRCLLSRENRAKARFLYSECNVGISDVARFLRVDITYVRSLLVNEMYRELDAEIADDGQYITPEFRKKGLKLKDLPLGKIVSMSSRRRLRSSAKRCPKAASLSDEDEEATETQEGTPQPPGLGEDDEETQQQVRNPSHLSADDQNDSDDDNDELSEFLENNASRISFAAYRGLLGVVGIGMNQLKALTYWTPAERSETLETLLLYWPVADGERPEQGIPKFKLVLLDKAIASLPREEEEEEDVAAMEGDVELISFLANPMPGTLAGISLLHQREKIVGLGVESMTDLNALAHPDWTNEEIARVLKQTFEGELTAFELMVLALGVRRLRGVIAAE
ncbi:hypothetical protein HMN09_00358100 [Mycena chlorophos]|uniref:Uncharacterized protein n=1 Tax=Mycena chlorophos TaxID=658473 RepID=A0A8H6WN68_MYCCL|nr:hypothetical protein HMN09_00358100 [Mycena chlorophos]